MGSHERLYALKGEIVARGIRRVFGLEMPIFAKRRFQQGSASQKQVSRLFPHNELDYRRHFHALHERESLVVTR
jgi:asparagine synthase (glutamine-hydrolysing)